jgi:putative oxidoreductase
VNRIINFLIRLKILKKDGIHILELLNGEPWQRWVPIPIRIILGVGFMVHGWAKWSRGPAAFAELLRQAHVPLPLANA